VKKDYIEWRIDRQNRQRRRIKDTISSERIDRYGITRRKEEIESNAVTSEAVKDQVIEARQYTTTTISYSIL